MEIAPSTERAFTSRWSATPIAIAPAVATTSAAEKRAAAAPSALPPPTRFAAATPVHRTLVRDGRVHQSQRPLPRRGAASSGPGEPADLRHSLERARRLPRFHPARVTTDSRAGGEASGRPAGRACYARGATRWL